MATKTSETRTWEQTFNNTREILEKKLQNTWADGRPLLKVLKKFQKTVPGGQRIDARIEYAEGQQAESYDHYGVLNTDAEDVWTRAYFGWRYLQVPIVVANTMLRNNRGPGKVADIFAERSSHAMETIKAAVEAQLHSDGTGNGSLDLLGLKSLLPYNPTTGTMGGRDRSTETDWRNETQDVTTAYTKASGVITAYTLLDYMRDYLLKCARDKGDEAMSSVCYTTQTVQTYLEEMNTTSVRIVNAEFADLGVITQHFRRVPILGSKKHESYLAGAGGETGHSMYLLNYNTLRWYVNSGANFKVTEMRELPYQDVVFARILLAAQLVCVNPRYNAVLYGIDAPSIS